MQAYAGSIWAGCTRTRTFATCVCVCVCLMRGDHLLRSISGTQANLRLSIAEAVVYAVTNAASEDLGAQIVVADVWGFLS